MFSACNCQSFAIAQICDVEPAFWCDFAQMHVPGMPKSTKTNKVLAVDLDDLKTVCFQIEIDGQDYISEPINDIEFE